LAIPSSYDFLYERNYVRTAMGHMLPSELKSPPLDVINSSGFLTLDDLNLLKLRLNVSANNRDSLIVDLGCGCGGLSFWLADIYSSQIVGIDSSPKARFLKF